MVQEHNTPFVSVVHPICCGLDVHKETGVACLLITGADGRVQSEDAIRRPMKCKQPASSERTPCPLS